MKWAKLKCSGKGRLELDFSEVKNCKKKKIIQNFHSDLVGKMLRIKLDNWPPQRNIRNKKTPIQKEKETKEFPGMVFKEALCTKR